MINSALITNKKRPNVIKVNGSVRRTSNGLTKALIPAITTATTKAMRKLETLTPGSKNAAIIIATAEINQFKSNFMY